MSKSETVKLTSLHRADLEALKHAIPSHWVAEKTKTTVTFYVHPANEGNIEGALLTLANQLTGQHAASVRGLTRRVKRALKT